MRRLRSRGNKKAPHRDAFFDPGDKNTDGYFFMPYFWRNFSTRPPVSTSFCLPV